MPSGNPVSSVLSVLNQLNVVVAMLLLFPIASLVVIVAFLFCLVNYVVSCKSCSVIVVWLSESPKFLSNILTQCNCD